MDPREIPRKDWPEFLESFGRRHRSWLATVGDVVDQPLESLAPEEGAIAIRFADGRLTRIEAPRALRVDVTGRGEELGLDFETGHGVARLRFRAAALPEELDGLAPEH